MSNRADILAQLSVADQTLVFALEAGATQAEALERAGIKRAPRGKRAKLIQAALDAKPAPQEVAAAAKRFEITEDAIMQRLAAVAFVNPRDYFDETGDIIPMHKLPAHAAVAV